MKAIKQAIRDLLYMAMVISLGLLMLLMFFTPDPVGLLYSLITKETP